MAFLRNSRVQFAEAVATSDTQSRKTTGACRILSKFRTVRFVGKTFEIELYTNIFLPLVRPRSLFIKTTTSHSTNSFKGRQLWTELIRLLENKGAWTVSNQLVSVRVIVH